MAWPGEPSYWQVLDISISLLVVMVSGVFAYIQTHQIVHINYIQFSVEETAVIKERIFGKKFTKWHGHPCLFVYNFQPHDSFL